MRAAKSLPAYVPRPWAWRPKACRPGQGLAEARVELLEPTGSDTLALLKLGGHAFTARLPPDAPLRAGDRARLLIDLSRLVCFDAATRALIA